MKRRAHRLAARFGLDGNPLRRRSDRIASLVSAGLFAAFLAGAPVASFAAWHVCDRVSVAEQQHQRAWHQVQAVVVRNVPIQEEYYYGGGSWSWGQWTAPAGHRHQGVIPVPDGTLTGSHVRLWVDATGQWSGPPLSRAGALARGVEAAVAAPLALAAMLFCGGLCRDGCTRATPAGRLGDRVDLDRPAVDPAVPDPRVAIQLQRGEP